MNEQKCPECGATLPENIQTCPQCGCPLPTKEAEPKYTAASSAPNHPATSATVTKKSKKKISIMALLGTIIGILVVLMGFNLVGKVAQSNVHNATEYDVPYSAFGADFYTEIYGATDIMADELNDIDKGIEKISYSATELIDTMYVCSGTIIMAIGLATIASSIQKIKKES